MAQRKRIEPVFLSLMDLHQYYKGSQMDIVIVRVGKDGGLPYGGSVLFRVGAAIQNGDDGGCRGARSRHGFLAFCCVLCSR